MWSNPDFVLPFVTLVDDEPGRGHLASLAYASRPYVIGNTIFRRPQRYTLRIATRLLTLDRTTVEKIMIHEAAHLGHVTHGQEFRDLVRLHGGSVTESALTDAAVRVQRKVGARYQTIETFEDELTAVQWMRAEMRVTPGRYRLEM